MRNKMNMKNKTHKCVPRNSQINLSAKSLNKEISQGNPLYPQGAKILSLGNE